MGVGFAPAAWALSSSGVFGRDGASDRSLVTRARDNDRAAFRAIFDRHAPGVHRFVHDLLRDAALADEATQETFVRAFRRMTSIHEDERLGAWLFGIARNVCHELSRSAGRAACDGGLAETGLVSPHTPETSLLGKEAATAMQRALGTLSLDRRAALLLRVDRGLPYEEIAVAMRWSLAKVKIEIHRARQHLRAQLEGPSR